jgi:macrophage erythroblast attacher
MLRFQQYIELIRSRSPPETAIAHAKKHLVPYRITYPKEFQQACGLLACPPDSPAAPAYADLYKSSRWLDLAELFTTTHNNLLALPSVPLLHIALSSGLSALKTPACHSHKPGTAESATSTLGHGVCPICSTELNDLARNVPYAHHTKSHVEHDLMLLPNGRVYGKERLEDQAKKAGLPGGVVKDLVTDDLFSTDSLKKVYIT